MTDPHPHTPTVSEEQASLYVLHLMDAQERRSFEQRLRRDAELRRCVQSLQGALEAEVFMEPAPAAPSRVWGKILERTRRDGTRMLPFPPPLLRWGPRLAAMAACLALGAFLQRLASEGHGVGALRSAKSAGRDASASRVARRTEAGGGIGTLPEAPAPSGALAQGGESPPSPASLSSPESSAGDAVAELESRNAVLQGTLRGLNARIAELTQQVQQLALVPSGVSRIHAFPLGLAGLPSSSPLPMSEGANRTNSLAESLARLAGERMAVALNSLPSAGLGQDPAIRSGLAGPGGAGLPAGVEPVGKVALVPAQPLVAVGDPSSSAGVASGPGLASVTAADPSMVRIAAGANNPSQTIAPIVFSAPDSGVHAVAVPSAPAGGQYQLWSRGADGTVTSLGVLTPSASPVSVVTFERGSIDGLFMSLEPVGGSLQPAGPLVGNGYNPVLPGLGRP